MLHVVWQLQCKANYQKVQADPVARRRFSDGSPPRTDEKTRTPGIAQGRRAKLINLRFHLQAEQIAGPRGVGSGRFCDRPPIGRISSKTGGSSWTTLSSSENLWFTDGQTGRPCGEDGWAQTGDPAPSHRTGLRLAPGTGVFLAETGRQKPAHHLGACLDSRCSILIEFEFNLGP